MLQRCCFVDLCRLGTSVIYTAWFHTLHRSVSARQRAPWRPFRSMHTLVRLTPFWRTNGDKYNVTNLWSGAHRDTHRSSSRRRTKHSSLGAQDWLWLSAQPTPPFSLTVVSSGSSCGFHKTCLFFCPSLWRKSVSPRPRTALSWMHVLAAPFGSHRAQCVCLHFASFDGSERSAAHPLLVHPRCALRGESFHYFIPLGYRPQVWRGWVFPGSWTAPWSCLPLLCMGIFIAKCFP